VAVAARAGQGDPPVEAGYEITINKRSFLRLAGFKRLVQVKTLQRLPGTGAWIQFNNTGYHKNDPDLDLSQPYPQRSPRHSLSTIGEKI
jgi:hypothetical protein